MASKPYERLASEAVEDFDDAEGGDKSLKVPWNTGVWARFPLVGLSCLLMVIASAVGALVVLLLSNGQSPGQWQHATVVRSRHFPNVYLECPPPSVLLAIINAVANICLFAAAGQGFAIYWWRRAVHGTTIRELHQQWYFSTSVLAFWCRPKFYSLAALVAIGTKISIADGILLQKATSVFVGSDNFLTNATMDVRSAINYPLTGYVTNGTVSGPTEPWALLSWLEGSIDQVATINQTYSGCDSGTCSFPLQALGFSIECEIKHDEVVNLSLITSGDVNATHVRAWDVGFWMSWAGAEKDYTSITYASAGIQSDFGVENDGLDGHCYVRYVETLCDLRPAILEFGNMTVANTTAATNAGISLPEMGIEVINGQMDEGVTVVSHLDIQEDGTGNMSSIGGIQFALNDTFSMEATMSFDRKSDTWAIENQRMPRGVTLPFWSSDATLRNATSICFFESYDPFAEMVAKLNTWTYLLSINAVPYANNPYQWQWDQPIKYSPAQVLATKEGYGAQYVTNKAYTAAAVASMLTCALLILPSYYGFWQLGRSVSLSPVEISHAFGAPILESTTIKGGIKHLKQEFGNVKVQYGVIGRGHRTRLGIARPGVVQSLKVH